MQFPNSTKEGGQAMCLGPDVCYIPAPPPPAGPGGIPTPFPNMGMHMQATKTTTKVYIRKKHCLIEGSEIPMSKLDEPGMGPNPPTIKGLVSKKNMAKVVFKKHSGKVKMQGKGVIFHTVPTMHNANNNPGMHSVPSQTQVFAAP